MTKGTKLILMFFLISLSSFKVTPSTHDKLAWIDIDQLNVKMKSESKPILIDLYTNWCYWCKVMDKKTYTNSKVISYINEHFYPVKFDAESKEIIKWKNKDYSYNETYKVSDFTLYVTNGQPGFPTTVIVPDEKSDPVAISGFMEPKELEPILKYFGEEAYKKQDYNSFKSTFKSTW